MEYLIIVNATILLVFVCTFMFVTLRVTWEMSKGRVNSLILLAVSIQAAIVIVVVLDHYVRVART